MCSCEVEFKSVLYLILHFYREQEFSTQNYWKIVKIIEKFVKMHLINV